MSFERLTDEGPKGRAATSREFRRDASRSLGIQWNPSAVRSGIRAKHESESELPPGANDYETTALSASPIVRGLFLV